MGRRHLYRELSTRLVWAVPSLSPGILGDSVHAMSVCSVYFLLGLGSLLCEGERWVRGFESWLENGFTLRVAIG